MGTVDSYAEGLVEDGSRRERMTRLRGAASSSLFVFLQHQTANTHFDSHKKAIHDLL